MTRILIIEDDRLVANIYRNKLTVEGFQVEVAHDGEAGLQSIKTLRPDVVLLDLMLPKLTGVEILRAMRAMPETSAIPAIVFSSTYLTGMVQEAWKAGASKCLSKANCSPKVVIDAVRGVLKPAAPAPQPAPTTTPPACLASVPQAIERGQSPDAEFQAELRREFIETLPETIGRLRTQLQLLIKADGDVARLRQLHELWRLLHALTGNSGIAGLVPLAHMSDALEVLLKDLYEKPTNITASTLRTVALGIDFLGYLSRFGTMPEHQEIPAVNILVVDDEAISRRAITYSLEKAKLKSVAVEDPQAALKLLAENPFDLVFLDVDMPGMDGFELCTRLRNLPIHRKTPVVFVTSLSDFETRTSSTMSGGNDFIAKPFLFIELAVKALIFVLRGKIEAGRAASEAKPHSA